MKHNRLFILFSIIALFHFELLKAQQKTLTLTEAIDLSIANSKQLKTNKAAIEEASGALKEAEDHRLPDFKISGSYLRMNNPNVDLKIKTGNADGGNPGGNAAATPKISQATYGIANLSLPIYSGQRIKYGIESAHYLLEASKLDADNEKEAVILNTIDAFSNLYKSKAAVNLVKENLQQSRQRDTDFSNLEKNGLLARNDLLKSELQTSQVELSLLEAENNWKQANVNMNLMLGLPSKTQLLPDSSGMNYSFSLKNEEEYEQLALQNRKDAEALIFRKKAAGSAIKSVKGELYPGIAFTGGYIAAYVPNLLTVTNAVNVGIGLNYSLSSLWKTKARIQQAEARQKQLEAQEGMLQDKIQLQINQAYNNYLLSQKKIEVYNKAIAQALENYKITKNKYDNSLVTTTELLDADVAQLQAKLNAAFGKIDALVAYNKLLQAAGLLGESLK